MTKEIVEHIHTMQQQKTGTKSIPLYTNYSLSVILPAHNEEVAISSTVKDVVTILSAWLEDFEVIVVNDGSKDRTKSLVEEIAAIYPQVRLINHSKNQGYGAALVSGFESITKELTFFMDSDGQFDIHDLEHFFPLIERYDAVLGYRMDRKDTLIRKLNAWSWKMLVYLVFGLSVRDIDCAFKLYRSTFFHLLSVAMFWLLRRGKTLEWWLAGGIGFLAALTRSTGLLLSIPYLIMYIRHFWIAEKRLQNGWLQRINALAPIILFPMGIVVYMIYLGYTKGNPFIFQSEEALNWHRHFVWIWMTIGYNVKLLLDGSFFSIVNLRNLLDFAFTLFPIVALVWAWKRLPLHYTFYALAVIIFSLSFPLVTQNPLASQPRYMIVLFPLFVIFALWGKNERFDQFYISIGPPLLAVTTILFISHFWVA